MKSINERLEQVRVVPVITINDADNAVPLAKVLMENGLPCAEITFRTPAAAESISNIRKAFPDMLLGAGTVLDALTVDKALDAGVDFIVSPGLNPTTVLYCQKRGATIIPGVNNPSQVERAMELGLNTLKFFPASVSGGPGMLKALSSVYPVRFMPTGGLSAANMHEYLAIKSVFACGGGWLAPSSLIDNQEWDKIAALVQSTRSALNS